MIHTYVYNVCIFIPVAPAGVYLCLKWPKVDVCLPVSLLTLVFEAESLTEFGAH